MTELKDCPFCGGKPKWMHAHNYEHLPKIYWCKCEAMKDVDYMELEAWNTRADDWQPIETAPKDGTKVLILADEGKLILQGYWNIAGERWKSTNQSGHPYPILYPCHWKPLPKGPSK